MHRAHLIVTQETETTIGVSTIAIDVRVPEIDPLEDLRHQEGILLLEIQIDIDSVQYFKA